MATAAAMAMRRSAVKSKRSEVSATARMPARLNIELPHADLRLEPAMSAATMASTSGPAVSTIR